MKLHAWSVLAALLCTSLACPNRVTAGSDDGAMPTVAVVSLAGYNAVRDDISYLGMLSGNPALADILEGALASITRSDRGLPGLDKERPWGAIVQSDGLEVRGLGFVPVTDLDALLAALAPLTGELHDAGDGLWQLCGKKGSLFLREHEGWAFVSQLPERLDDLPDDPVALLEGLPEQYDAALRIHVQQIPEFARWMIIDHLRNQADPALTQLAADRGLPAKDVRRKHREQLAAALETTDTVTLGWRLDGEAKHGALELAQTLVEPQAVAASKQQERPNEQVSSRFALAGAAAASRMNGPLTEEQAAELSRQLTRQRDEMIEQVDSQLNDPFASELVGETIAAAFDMVEKQVASGVYDMGIAVLPSDPPTWLIGGRVQDGQRLEQSIRALEQNLGGDPSFPDMQFDVAEHDGIRVHSIVSELPPLPSRLEDEVREQVGDLLFITFALSDDVVLLAIGPEGADAVEQMLAKRPSQKAQPSIATTVHLLPVLDYLVEERPEDPVLLLATETLREGGHADGVHLTARARRKSNTVTLRLDSGALQALATYGSMQALRRMAGL